MTIIWWALQLALTGFALYGASVLALQISKSELISGVFFLVMSGAGIFYQGVISKVIENLQKKLPEEASED